MLALEKNQAIYHPKIANKISSISIQLSFQTWIRVQPLLAPKIYLLKLCVYLSNYTISYSTGVKIIS